MSFIFGILVLGALLAAVFGKRIGAMFVLGTATVALIPLGLVVFAVLALVIGMVMQPQQSTSYSSPSQSYNSPPSQSYNSAQAAPAQRTVNVTQPAGPSIGIAQVSVPKAASDKIGISPGYGFMVSSVAQNSPAAQAGLIPYDVVTSVDEFPIPSLDTLSNYEASLGAGTPIKLFVYRDSNGVLTHWIATVTPSR